jgi:hypothetical protein
MNYELAVPASIKRARGCKKLQKFAENCRKNTAVCKILQKIAEKIRIFAQLFHECCAFD